MSTSLILFEKEHAAAEKYSYFICTVAGALFAYIAKDYTPHKLDFWYFYVMPVSLLCLTGCFFFGILKITLSISFTRHNRQILIAEEQIEDRVAALRENHKLEVPHDIVVARTGKKYNRAELEKEIDVMRQAIVIKQKIMRHRVGRLSNFSAILTHIFLFVAFVLIVASKILQPYFGN